ncbi:hemolysin D [Campylobacterota bacterium]|nr:hemolysin D [Campylobacterota bacterium]
MGSVDMKKLYPTNSRKKWWIIGAILLIICAGTYAAYFVGWFGKEEVISFVTVQPKRQDLKVAIQATGNLEPIHTVTVGIEVSGTLKEVLADYNDRVKKGAVLARLDTTKLESALLSSRAQLQVATANVESSRLAMEDAKLQIDRLTEIFESTNGAYPSQKEIDTARTAYERSLASLSGSRASLEQAKAEVATGEENLRKAVVVSPIDGIVLTRSIDVGQTVAASMQTPTLFTIAEDLSKMQVIVAVDEADVGEVRAGQGVAFSVNAYPNREFSGTVKQVRLGSQITNGVVTYDTVVEVDNADGLLRPGMTAQTSIVTKLVPNALVVPNAAFRFTPPSDAAKTIMEMRPGAGSKPIAGGRLHILENGAPKEVRVKRGDSDGTVSAIESGEINENSQVITSIRQAV